MEKILLKHIAQIIIDHKKKTISKQSTLVFQIKNTTLRSMEVVICTMI